MGEFQNNGISGLQTSLFYGINTDDVAKNLCLIHVLKGMLYCIGPCKKISNNILQ